MICFPNDPGHSACGEGPPGAGRSRFNLKQNTLCPVIKSSKIFNVWCWVSSILQAWHVNRSQSPYSKTSRFYMMWSVVAVTLLTNYKETNVKLCNTRFFRNSDYPDPAPASWLISETCSSSLETQSVVSTWSYTTTATLNTQHSFLLSCYPNDPGHSACGEGPPGAWRSRFILNHNAF